MLIAKVNGTAVESFSFYGTNDFVDVTSISTADKNYLTSISSLPVISELPYNTATETIVAVDPFVKNGFVYTVAVKKI